LTLLATAVFGKDERSVQIVFGGIQCYKTTSGPGDDQPYAVIVAVDVRSGKIISGEHSFGDVGEDELHKVNVVIGNFSPLEQPDDCVLLVAFAEWDHGPATSFDGSGAHSLLMKESAVKKITPIVKKYQAYYAASAKWRPQVVEELTKAMNAACSETLGHDDRIGVEVMRLQIEDMEGPQDRSVERRVTVQGDGGAYVLYFDIKSSDALFSAKLPGVGIGGPGGPGTAITPGMPVFPVLTGKWNSNLGLTEFIQNGANVTGVVHFPNQVVGKVTGKVSHQTVDCQWFVHVGNEGTAKLAISDDGKVLSGSYASSTDPNFKGDWKLTRLVEGPPKIPNLVGVWRQLPGNSGLPQVSVTIGQDGAQPANFACRIPDMQLFGKGKIAADQTVTASFGAPNTDMTDFGPVGAFSQAKGKITKVDAAGRALRIEWDSGVVYERN
jgi:hypothetical protein